MASVELLQSGDVNAVINETLSDFDIYIPEMIIIFYNNSK